MVEVVYYSPSIPDIESTARYVHATALPEYLDAATLVTESEPPAGLADRYDDVRVLDGGTIANARRAARIADGVDAGDDQLLYVTTFHYAPVLSGALSDRPWVVGVYDNPVQYALNNPKSYHQLTARLLPWLIGRADGVVHEYSPYGGKIMGADPRFTWPGCPVDLIEPQFDPPADTLECVWAGSPRLDRGMPVLVDALERVDGPVHVSVFGDADDAVTELATRSGVDDSLTFHGWTPHDEVCDAIADAHVGLCVLPNRRDWYHSSPLKVREYLAGGTIPLCSDFPGIRATAESAGVYTEPTAAGLAERLDWLVERSRSNPKAITARMRQGRQKAEMTPISWCKEWFVRQCVSSGLGVELLLEGSA